MNKIILVLCSFAVVGFVSANEKMDQFPKKGDCVRYEKYYRGPNSAEGKVIFIEEAGVKFNIERMEGGEFIPTEDGRRGKVGATIFISGDDMRVCSKK